MPRRRPIVRQLSLLRPWPALLALSVTFHQWDAQPAAFETATPEKALAQWLADRHNLSASPSDVHWIEPRAGSPWVRGRDKAWVLARHPGALDDVYLVHASRSPEGQLLSLDGLYNITDTYAAAERQLVADGPLAAWSVGDDQHSYRVRVLDLGVPREMPGDFGWQQRMRWHLTWQQRYGEFGGITERQLELVPAPRDLRLRVANGTLEMRADGEHIVVPRGEPPAEGSTFIRERQEKLPPPGNWITWTVDRVRASPWVGDERLQWVKAIAYRAKDWAERTFELDLGDDTDQFETRVATNPRTPAPLPSGQPEATGRFNDRWPPAPLTPKLEALYEGEGVWQSLEGDPFVKAPPGLDTAFVTTFIRTDEERKFARTLIVLWDPAVVELHMMSGTEEPKSATGATGAGRIPRQPGVLRRVVAAFNGGFQGTHGDYGMMAEGTVYLPPLPYAATVARFVDGTTAFGTWPQGVNIPGHFSGLRQNLTPLVEGARPNPHGRTWWGGVPQGWKDDTQTVRSGLCLTEEGFIAYFYGTKIDAEHLGESMLAARCEYGMHLDMNQGHTGLEFYNVDEAEKMPPLALPLQPIWQAEGELPDAPAFRFRGRRLFRGMQLMNFPRYIGHEARDFFYLTIRSMLPGQDLSPAGALAGEGQWVLEGLPQHGRPYVIARTSVRPDPSLGEASLNVLKLDPFRFAPSNTTPSERWLASWQAPDDVGEAALWWRKGDIRVGTRPPPDASVLFRGTNVPSAETFAAAARNQDGHLLYAEFRTGSESAGSRRGELIRRGLELAGAESVVYLPRPAGWVLEGRDLNLHPAASPPKAVHLSRSDQAGFERIFKDTPVVKRSVWQPLQSTGKRKTSRSPGGKYNRAQPADSH